MTTTRTVLTLGHPLTIGEGVEQAFAVRAERRHSSPRLFAAFVVLLGLNSYLWGYALVRGV